MALKFLNKKGWHTGSLRNIENVWKAEQKHEAEEKKLDELRKQIQEERERHEFRLLQEQAGLVPKQERLDFLYDSGLAVGKGSNSDGGGFKALEAKSSTDTAKALEAPPSSAAVPGALFEVDKPHSANDAWRKLHSDPLLMIRQREQQALARIKNNPVQMAIIRKSVEEKAPKKKDHDKKESRKKHHHSSSKYQKHSSSRQQSDSEKVTADGGKRKAHKHRSSNYDVQSSSEDESSKMESQSNKNRYKGLKYKEQPMGRSGLNTAKNDGQDGVKGNHRKSEQDKFSSEGRANHDVAEKDRERRKFREASTYYGQVSHSKHRNGAPKLSEEERAARLREMQVDAELHEEQRWKRLRRAEEEDAREVTQNGMSRGRNFLDATQKSVYGAEKGGSSTIEESVRRRTHYLQGRSEAHEGNAFRR